MARPPAWRWLGRIGYRAAWELQESLRERILAGDDGAETILFCEHDPVITLGRSTRPGSLLVPPEELARRGVELVETSRGGDATAHGPGQLVVYPVVRLTAGVLRHVEGVGRAIAEELAARGIAGAEWRRDPAGVWIGADKIAACGIHVRRRVAIHGFALNVTDEPLALFSLIVPCGLACVKPTSMAAHGVRADPEGLAAALAARIAKHLACDHHPGR